MPTDISEKDLEGMIVSTLAGLRIRREKAHILILDSNSTTCFRVLKQKELYRSTIE